MLPAPEDSTCCVQFRVTPAALAAVLELGGFTTMRRVTI
jgi:hypothetical protein